MSHAIIPSQAPSTRTPANAPTAKAEASDDSGGSGAFTALLAAALTDVDPTLAEATHRGDVGDEEVAQGIAALAELLSDEEQEVTAEMLALLASLSSQPRDGHGPAPAPGTGGGIANSAAVLAAAASELVAAPQLADGEGPSPVSTATTTVEFEGASSSTTGATSPTSPTALDALDATHATGSTDAADAGWTAGGGRPGAVDPAVIGGTLAATESSAADDGATGRIAASAPAGSEMDPLSGPAPATAAVTDAEPLPAAARTETASATHARLVARVMDALDVLENAPPPRRMTIEVPDAEGLRLQIALRGGEVHVSVQSGGSPDLTGWSRELSAGLAARGFSLGGFDSGSRQQPRDDDAQGQGPAPGTAPDDAPQRAVRTDHDLRL